MTDIQDFVDRYVAVWNEADPEVRRQAIAALWSQDGVEFVETVRYRGHQALQARITEAHQQFVQQGGFVFRSAGDAVGHHDAVRFTAYMLPAEGGAVAWTGFVVALLDGQGRIRCDYQFADPPPSAVSTGASPGTRAVVEELLRRSGQGDPESIAELYAEKVDWRVSWPVAEHPAVPWIRPRFTRADVAAHFRVFRQTCAVDAGEVAIDKILIDGSDAVLVGTSSQLVNPTGKRFTMAFALHLTIEGGLLTRHHMYEDSLAVTEAFTA